MKERTKQWNDVITKVFDFDYTDFQPEATNVKSVSLDWVKKRTAIIYAQIKHSIPFSGAGITEANVYLGETSVFTPITNLPAAIINYNCFGPVSNTLGAGKSIPLRDLPSQPAPSSIILNHAQATELFLILKLGAGEIIDNLVAGSATIWFTTIQIR